MKTYTAIYSTETISGIHYSFQAQDTESAVSYAAAKFSAFPNIAILEDNGGKFSNEGVLVFLNGSIINGADGSGNGR